MTQISRDDVLHLAALSGLKLTDKEIDMFPPELARILAYVNQLDELDTSNIEPTYQVTNRTNIFRDDIIEQSEVTREMLLALAPQQQDQQIKVQKVL